MFFCFAFAESRKTVSIRFYLFNRKSQSIQPFFIHLQMVKISKLLPLIIYFHRISCEDDVMTELFEGYDKAIGPNHSKYVQK